MSDQVVVDVSAKETCLVDTVGPYLAQVACVVLAEVALETAALRDVGGVGWGNGESRTGVCGIVCAVVVLRTHIACGGRQA